MQSILSKVAIAATVVLGLQVSAHARSFELGTVVGTKTFEATTATGTFNDLYTFTSGLTAPAGLAATSVSFDIYGATVTGATLYAGTYTNVADLASAVSISAPTQIISSNSGSATITTLASSANLVMNGTYTYQITGNSIGAAGYTGIIALTNLPTVPAVPEPETYAMLLAGLGMMGMIARRRQKNR
jgi:hypothetical protein